MVAVQHDEQPKVETAAQLFQEIIYQNKDRLSAGIIVAGWDKRNGGAVYNIPLGGGKFQQPWAIGGECAATPHLSPPPVGQMLRLTMGHLAPLVPHLQAPGPHTFTASAILHGDRAGARKRPSSLFEMVSLLTILR